MLLLIFVFGQFNKKVNSPVLELRKRSIFVYHYRHKCRQYFIPKVLPDELSTGYIHLFFIDDKYLLALKFLYYIIFIEMIKLPLLTDNNCFNLVQCLAGVIPEDLL